MVTISRLQQSDITGHSTPNTPYQGMINYLSDPEDDLFQKQQVAKALGHSSITGKLKRNVVDAIFNQFKSHPSGFLTEIILMSILKLEGPNAVVRFRELKSSDRASNVVNAGLMLFGQETERPNISVVDDNNLAIFSSCLEYLKKDSQKSDEFPQLKQWETYLKDLFYDQDRFIALQTYQQHHLIKIMGNIISLDDSVLIERFRQLMTDCLSNHNNESVTKLESILKARTVIKDRTLLKDQLFDIFLMGGDYNMCKYAAIQAIGELDERGGANSRHSQTLVDIVNDQVVPFYITAKALKALTMLDYPSVVDLARELMHHLDDLVAGQAFSTLVQKTAMSAQTYLQEFRVMYLGDRYSEGLFTSYVSAGHQLWSYASVKDFFVAQLNDNRHGVLFKTCNQYLL
tara:strand:+ start:2557 stop:3762 length:1206 start_codon:yes stop_codon:yes gene_type:complete